MNEREQAERLNTFLRAELAAVLAYQNAIRSVDGRLGDGISQIRAFAAAHQRTVAALQVCIRTLGGIAAAEAGTWGTFAQFRDVMSVHQLLGAEERGLAEYEAALPSLHGEVRDLIEHELIPRQQEHVATLTRLLSAL